MADNVNTAEPEVSIILNVNSLFPQTTTVFATTTTTTDSSDLFTVNNNTNNENQKHYKPPSTLALSNDSTSRSNGKKMETGAVVDCVGSKNHVTFSKNHDKHLDISSDDGDVSLCSKHRGGHHHPHHHHHHRRIHDSYTSYTTTTNTTASPTSTTDSDESSSSSSSSSSADLLNRAPDGGWGWVVVFASFMVNMIADGVTFSFGVIFIEFEKYFDEGKSKTAWIGSLFMAVPLLSGPIASFLTDRYGCQKVTIIGSIIASTGFVISAFADSLFTLFITFGLISGFGLSLCYVAAVVIVAYYFDKKRSLATGLSVCGSGIGTFIFAPLNHELLSHYGWRGCTLILAGLFLNLCVFGMLMRDLPWTMEKAQNEWKKKKDARLQKRRLKSTASYDRHSQHTHLQSSPTTGSCSKGEIEQMFQDELLSHHDSQGCPETTKDFRLCNSLVNLPTFVRDHENVPLEVLEALTQKKQLYSVLVQNYPSLLIPSKSFSDSGRINDMVNPTLVFKYKIVVIF